jgi:hypothetical protein
MSKIKYPEQAEKIQRLMKDAGLTIDEPGIREVARRMALQYETVEKYVWGWNPVGQSSMANIENICELIREQALRMASQVKTANATAAPPLQEEAVQYATKLMKLTERQRDLAKQIIDEFAPEEKRKKPVVIDPEETIQKVRDAAKTKKPAVKPNPHPDTESPGK